MVEKREDGWWAEQDLLCESTFLLPVGSMFWQPEAHTGREGRAGRPAPHLAVMTPAGLWCIDCPATGSDHMWDRTGEPPHITATPSINIGPERWHGWLTGGALVR